MHLGGKTSEQSLKYSIWNSLRIGNNKNLKSIAFPAIGTGIAGFPLDECAKIMLEIFCNFLKSENHNYNLIEIVLFSEKDYLIFKKIFTQYFDQIGT